MPAKALTPVRYDRPPVLEVSCGIAFRLQRPLKSAHIGLYWSKVAEEFPRCEDAAPVQMVLEGTGVDSAVQYEFLNMPELRRAWLINVAGTHLIQLQEDRFIFNWKRSGDSDYPSFDHVGAEFWRHWDQYREFLVDQKLGEPVPVQCELTYANFVAGEATFLKDLRREESAERFLPSPEAVNSRSQFLLPDGAGRLHVQVVTGALFPTGPGHRFDLTARGLPKDISRAGCEEWFRLAHDWVTHGFTDLTTTEAHKMWGRTA
jgi:uncharacterized protein (TIGR04255 family)